MKSGAPNSPCCARASRSRQCASCGLPARPGCFHDRPCRGDRRRLGGLRRRADAGRGWGQRHLFEASRTLGGRARAVELAGGCSTTASTSCSARMRRHTSDRAPAPRRRAGRLMALPLTLASRQIQPRLPAPAGAAASAGRLARRTGTGLRDKLAAARWPTRCCTTRLRRIG